MARKLFLPAKIPIYALYKGHHVAISEIAIKKKGNIINKSRYQRSVRGSKIGEGSMPARRRLRRARRRPPPPPHNQLCPALAMRIMLCYSIIEGMSRYIWRNIINSKRAQRRRRGVKPEASLSLRAKRGPVNNK